MKEMISCCLSIFFLYTAVFHASYAVDRIPEPALDPGPSADSPAPSSSPVESPESSLGPQQGVFDVNQYGATADGETESSKAILATWDAACSYAGNSTFYVPEGEFLVGPISFAGPCYNNQSLEVKIEGTLIAASSLNDFPDSNWIEFKQLNGMILYGSNGVTNFDAQGAVEAWRQISCRNSMECKELITSLKFSNISDGTISNITLINSKAFHVSLQGSNNIIMKNITITAPWDSPNTDGDHLVIPQTSESFLQSLEWVTIVSPWDLALAAPTSSFLMLCAVQAME